MPRHLRRRKKILNEVITTHQVSPTLRDLAVWTGLAPSVVHYHLHCLADLGAIRIINRGNRQPLKIIPATEFGL